MEAFLKHQAIYIVILSIFFNCVQETKPKTIQFKVDMRKVEAFKDVGIRGNTYPLSWNETLFLSDADRDSIFEGSIQLNSASYDIEFKFVNNSDDFELRDQNNRNIRFQYEPESFVYEAIFDEPKGKISKTN